MDKIVIEKDGIRFDKTKITAPLSIEEVNSLLGTPETQVLERGLEKAEEYTVAKWNGTGLSAQISDEGTTYSTFVIQVAEGEPSLQYDCGVFGGEVLIGKKPYAECNMEYDGFMFHEMKQGCFNINTFLMKDIDEVAENEKKFALEMSRIVEIDYIKPKKKTTKYKQKKVEGDVLTFKNFNFKLAVLQVLMYEKGLIEPKFDIYEFAEEYSRREIDVEEDGYEPIKEAVNWFKKLEIPASLADEVDKIVMDGGDDIYMQIYPFWDGEDDYFDLKKVTAEEVAQFKNLKEITIMSENYAKIAKIFEELGIKTQPL